MGLEKAKVTPQAQGPTFEAGVMETGMKEL
jgi:hypothetical protein